MTRAELRKAEMAFQAAHRRTEAKRAERNRLVFAALREGWTHAQIADATGLTRGRIGQLADSRARGDMVGWPNFPLSKVLRWLPGVRTIPMPDGSDQAGLTAVLECGHNVSIPDAWDDREQVPCGMCAND